MSLEGKTAIVTGGSRGIGLAIVKALLNKKVSVATIDLQFTERIGECKKIAKDMEVQFLNWEGDISLRLNVEKFVDAVIAKIGRPSILVNNAGIASPGELMRLKEEQWDNVMKINVKGSFILTQVVASHMIKLNGGTIINIASMSGLEPLSGSGAYSISKAALIMLSKQLALELAKYGIRVNAVCPGMIHTPLNEDVLADPEIRRQREALVPIGRIGTPEDIARTVCFLVSDEASYITGQAIVVDGGLVGSIQAHIPGRPISKLG